MKISLNDVVTSMIASILIGGGGAYFAMWKDLNSTKRKVQNIEQRSKPSYMSEDKWNLEEGIRKYEEKRYDSALTNFNKITELFGNDSVKWKYYESLCKFKLLRHKKYVKIAAISPSEMEEIERVLRSLIKSKPNSRFSEGIRYWLAQTLFHFKDLPNEAFVILKKLRDDYPSREWKEGTLYYMAESLLSSGDEEDRESAINYLEELRQKHPNGLIRIIEEDAIYYVEDVVRKKLSDIEEY